MIPRYKTQCFLCNKFPVVHWKVNNQIWKEIVGVSHRKYCIECFMELCQCKGIEITFEDFVEFNFNGKKFNR